MRGENIHTPSQGKAGSTARASLGVTSCSSLWLLLFLLLLSLTRIRAQAPPEFLGTTLGRIAQLRLSGDSAGALSEYQKLEAGLAPALIRANHLDYLKAVLLEEASRPEASCKLLGKLSEGFPLKANLLLHQIECSEGRTLEERRPFFEEFLKLAGNHPRRLRVAFRFAQLLRDSGALEEAKKRFDNVWRPRSELWREAALEHALLHIPLGDPASAIQDLENLIARHETGSVAHRAVIELAKLQSGQHLSEPKLRKRVRIYMNQRDTEPARRLLQELLERFPRSSSVDQYLYQMGRTYVLDENYPVAIQAYETAYRHSRDETWGVRSKYLVANTALRMDDFDLARKTYQYVIENHPTNPYAVDARFNLADTYRWLKEPDQAEEAAKQAISAVSSVDRRRFYYFLARLYLEEKRYSESLEQLARLERYSSRHLPSGVTREEIFYLKGLNLKELGRPSEAEEAFKKAVQTPSNYFSQLALLEFPREPKDNSQEDGKWLALLLRPRAFASEPPDPPGREDFRERARLLLMLRLYDEAAMEIRRGGSAIFQGRRDDYLFNRAYYAALGGLAEESLNAAEVLGRTAFSRTEWQDYPRVIQTLIYPRHYSKQILAAARAEGIDPDLILAVMKQESRFAADAFSPATARGLMQFMVPTAQELSREAGVDFQEPSDLFVPDFSIRLGSLYLSKLLKQFGGSAERALAAYNGGPENAARWNRKLTWKRPDLFVANIGFRETKLYVLKVMGNYYAYRNLYGESDSAVASGWITGSQH